MPGNKEGEKLPTGNYFEQKSMYIKQIKRLLVNQRKAIETLDAGRLSATITEIERIQAKVEGLDKENALTGSNKLSAEERSVLAKLLDEVSQLGKGNAECLRKQREMVQKELKEIRTKSSARKAYNTGKTPKSLLSTSR